MLKPYPFQKTAIRLGKKGNLLCCDDCGLGKTLVGVEIARQRNKGPNLVVCKKPARLQWKAEIERQDPRAQVQIADRLTDIEVPKRKRHFWLVIHFEVTLPLHVKKPPKNDLLRTSWATFIVDEAHGISNRNAQRTRAIKKIKARRRVALTATEMEQDPSNMWSILNWLDKKGFKAYHGFRARYTRTDKNPFHGYEEVLGAKARNMPELAERLNRNGLYIRRTKAEVAKWLPPLKESFIPLALPKKLHTIYKEIRYADDIIVRTGDERLVVPNVLARITLLQRVLSEGRQGVPSEKQKWVLDYVADNPKENILVFTRFRRTAQALSKALKAPMILGGKRLPDLAARPRVLVGTVKAMGESLDLPWFTTGIFVDSEWSSRDMEQAKNRIHRLSSKEPQQIIYLYHPKTEDEHVIDALRHKWDTITLVRAYLRGEK